MGSAKRTSTKCPRDNDDRCYTLYFMLKEIKEENANPYRIRSYSVR